MKITYRPAMLSDIDGMVKLEHECFTTDQLTAVSLRRFLQGKTASIIIAVAGTEVIGLALLLFRKNSRTARIYSLAVQAKYRAQGIALQLHAELESAARRRGCHTMMLEVRYDNTRARQFYDQLGYQEWGTYTAFYEDGSDALRMKKNF